MPSAVNQQSGTKTRLAFIDGLRGIASLAVVIYHVYSKNLVPMTGFQFPEPVHSIFSNTNLGVHVFFVISGFVIAQSILGEPISPRFVGWFALRRSVRLDPPYWVTIAAMVVLTCISNHMQHDRSLPIPSIDGVVAHLFYAQAFFGFPHIVGVFWTLCYEIQFYLALVILVGICQWIARKVALADTRALIFLPVWIASAACIAGYLDLSNAVFLYGWLYFFLGVAVNWAYQGSISPVVLYTIFAGSLAIMPFAPLQMGVAATTAISIHLVARAGRLATWTMGRVIQYLGRISYSLYLVHMLVGTPLVRFGIRMLGRQPDTLRAIALTVMAVAISVVAAQLMYVLVERPAMRLSQKLRRRGREAR